MNLTQKGQGSSFQTGFLGHFKHKEKTHEEGRLWWADYVISLMFNLGWKCSNLVFNNKYCNKMEIMSFCVMLQADGRAKITKGQTRPSPLQHIYLFSKRSVKKSPMLHKFTKSVCKRAWKQRLFSVHQVGHQRQQSHFSAAVSVWKLHKHKNCTEHPRPHRCWVEFSFLTATACWTCTVEERSGKSYKQLKSVYDSETEQHSARSQDTFYLFCLLPVNEMVLGFFF